MKRSPDHLVAALDTLLKSEGWQLVKDRMAAEVDILVKRIASTPSLSQDELHWHRGVIYSATQLLEVPERIKTQLKNDALLAQAATAKPSTVATSPAKAGQKGKS